VVRLARNSFDACFLEADERRTWHARIDEYTRA
jgi:adenosine deaminase